MMIFVNPAPNYCLGIRILKMAHYEVDPEQLDMKTVGKTNKKHPHKKKLYQNNQYWTGILPESTDLQNKPGCRYPPRGTYLFGKTSQFAEW